MKTSKEASDKKCTFIDQKNCGHPRIVQVFYKQEEVPHQKIESCLPITETRSNMHKEYEFIKYLPGNHEDKVTRKSIQQMSINTVTKSMFQ